MLNLYLKLKNRVKRDLFYLIYSKKFKYFDYGVYIVSPYRVEGHKYIDIKQGVSIQSMSWLLALKQNEIIPSLIIEEGTTIGRFSHIVTLRYIHIGKDVLIADKVYISDNIHSYEDVNTPIINQPILHKGDVNIGDNSWIGENVSIIGANIGKHCIIGANSVVIKDIPDFSVAVGSPAKVIKRYNSEKKIWEKVK